MIGETVERMTNIDKCEDKSGITSYRFIESMLFHCKSGLFELKSN